MNYTFTDEDIKLVEKFIDIKNRGLYADSAQLTNVYNRVLNKHATPTSCGSCIRARVQELENALNHFKAKIALESKKEQEENKAADASTPKENEDIKERMARVRAARKVKK